MSERDDVKKGKPSRFPLTWEEAGCPPALKAKEWEGFFHSRSRPRHPHAAAAIALYERDFGFTREMLVALGEIIVDARVMHGDRCTEADERQECERNAEFADAIFDRIEALLPPEES